MSTLLKPRESTLITLDQLGLYESIFGAEAGRGIASQGDIVTKTADGFDLNLLWNEFQATLDVFNASRSKMVEVLTYGVTELVEHVTVAGGGDFEEASEFGVAKSIRPNVDGFFMGYDFKWYDLATRFTWLFLADAPANRVQAYHAQALEADNRLVFRKVLGTLFSNVTRAASYDGQPVNVYPFYNGDAMVPPPYKNTTFTAPHQHYKTSGAATVDSGDLEDIYDNIAEHGYGHNEGSTIVLMVNKQEANAIRRFKANVENANSAVALYDFIPSSNQPTQILPGLLGTQSLLGQLPPSTWQGLPVIGSYGYLLIVEDSFIPPGYLVAFATGGESNLQNPIGIREHANPALRGLRLINGEKAGYPIINSYYQRGFGTGVRHRGAAAITQVSASATYTPPSEYPFI